MMSMQHLAIALIEDARKLSHVLEDEPTVTFTVESQQLVSQVRDHLLDLVGDMCGEAMPDGARLSQVIAHIAQQISIPSSRVFAERSSESEEEEEQASLQREDVKACLVQDEWGEEGWIAGAHGEPRDVRGRTIRFCYQVAPQHYHEARAAAAHWHQIWLSKGAAAVAVEARLKQNSAIETTPLTTALRLVEQLHARLGAPARVGFAVTRRGDVVLTFFFGRRCANLRCDHDADVELTLIDPESDTETTPISVVHETPSEMALRIQKFMAQAAGADGVS